jgi:hypothetical protein
MAGTELGQTKKEGTLRQVFLNFYQDIMTIAGGRIETIVEVAVGGTFGVVTGPPLEITLTLTVANHLIEPGDTINATWGTDKTGVFTVASKTAAVNPVMTLTQVSGDVPTDAMEPKVTVIREYAAEDYNSAAMLSDIRDSLNGASGATILAAGQTSPAGTVYRWIEIIEDTVFTTLDSTNVTGSGAGALTAITWPQFFSITGIFTSITVTSGKVIAYKQRPV